MSFSSFWRGNTGKAIRKESIELAIASVWFIAIFTVVITVLNIVFARTGLIDESTGKELIVEYLVSFNNSYMWFILVCGICMPLKLKNMLYFGLTRGQFATGVIGAGVLISAGFMMFVAVVSAVIGRFSPADMPTTFLLVFSYWLFGWFTAAGFQYRSVFTATVGITLSVFLIYATIRYVNVDQIFGTWNESTGLATLSALGVVVLVAADVLMAAILRLLTKHIPIRC
jgi:hypothetical protein